MTTRLAPSDIKAEMTEYFASILRVPAQQIEGDAHILELGVDSIMLIEAQRWLKSRFGCSVEIQQLFEELNTIDRLAAYLAVSQSDKTDDPGLTAKSKPIPAVPSPGLAFGPGQMAASGNGYSLLRSQLTLLGDVIEAQNRLLMTFKQPRAISDDA